jgi:hypothetical protein
MCARAARIVRVSDGTRAAAPLFVFDPHLLAPLDERDAPFVHGDFD